MIERKYNKRAGKYTPVLRCLKTKSGARIAISVVSGKLLVCHVNSTWSYSFGRSWAEVNNLTYKSYRDWLIKKAAN